MKFLLLFFVVIGCAHAVEQPQPDLNGYTAKYQHPILYPGDTLDSAWSGPIAYTIPTPADGTPSCSGGSGVESGEYWIRDSAGMSQLEQGNLGYRIYWVCPGDYRTSVGSTLNLADSGSGSSDGNIVKVMCWASDMRKNPVQRNPNWRDHPSGSPLRPNFDFSDECVFPKINTAGYDNWFFHGVSVTANSWGTQQAVRIVHGSFNIVFDHTRIACYYVEPGLTGTHLVCLLFEGNGATSNPDDLPQGDSWLQNSVLGPCGLIYDADTTAFGVENDTTNNRVVNVDIIDCPITLLTGGNELTGTGEGFVMENVSTIITEHLRIGASSCGGQAWYNTGIKCASGHGGCAPQNAATSSSQRRVDISTGGAQAGLMDPNGVCACTQQSLNHKMGSDNPSNPMIYLHNRISGWRGQNSRCGADGGTRGYGMLFLEAPYNTEVLNNIVYNTRNLFTVATSQQPPGLYDNMIVHNNIFDGIHYDDTGTMGSPARAFAWGAPGACTGCELSFNTYVELDAPVYARDLPFSLSGSDMEINCNTFRGGAYTDSTSNPVGQGNVAIDGADLSGWTNVVNTLSLTKAQAADNDYTFWDLLQSYPVQITLPDISPAATSQYIGTCNAL